MSDRDDAGRELGLGDTLRGILDQPRLRPGVALGRLAKTWDAIVGDRLAAHTWPVALDDGVLVVAATSPAWAVQARFLAEEIRRAAASAAGRVPVRSVRVTVRPDGLKTPGQRR